MIVHRDGKISVIDVNNAKAAPQSALEKAITQISRSTSESKGDFNQKEFPVNPIEYYQKFGITSVFRFILTHPDMDHMDGVKDFFEIFNPINFWDTDNKKEMDFEGSPYNEDDWNFYTNIRDGKTDQKRLVLLNGATGQFWNRNQDNASGGNGLSILAPTTELVELANENETWNDISYVLLYRTHNFKVLFGGDADNATWEYLLENAEDDISNVDLLIAPHHGRKSSCSYEFLNVVNPKMTFFGNADKASHLATDMFKKLKLEVITNNQGGCLIADIDDNGIHIYVTYKGFAEVKNPKTFYNSDLDAYFVKTVK